MKNLLLFAATAVVFASCGSNQPTPDNASQAKIDSMSQVLLRQHIVDSINLGSAENAAAPANAPVVRNNGSASYGHSHANNGGGGRTTNNTQPVNNAPVTNSAPTVSNTSSQPTAAELAAQKKEDHRKELNSAAAGALIGAGAGAIGGAIAGKNDHFKKEDAAIGAGVGAVLGAGTGLLLQKHKIKKRDTTK